MRNAKKLDRPIRLYHLSCLNHNGETFKPRVPDTVMTGENKKIKRICVSSSMTGAFRAINFYGEGTYYVHVPEDMGGLLEREAIYKPTTKMVPDCNETREYWIRKPARMKCIGLVKFSYGKNDSIKLRWVKKL